MSETLSMDEKWELVKDYYESCYRHPETGQSIRFKTRLADDQIDLLYKKMHKLGSDEYYHLKKLREIRLPVMQSL